LRNHVRLAYEFCSPSQRISRIQRLRKYSQNPKCRKICRYSRDRICWWIPGFARSARSSLFLISTDSSPSFYKCLRPKSCLSATPSKSRNASRSFSSTKAQRKGVHFSFTLHDSIALERSRAVAIESGDQMQRSAATARPILLHQLLPSINPVVKSYYAVMPACSGVFQSACKYWVLAILLGQCRQNRLGGRCKLSG
jgi:hypothetical protein